MRTLVLAAALLIPTSPASPPPLVPLVTDFIYAEHGWIQWMPTHPVYESIEAHSTRGSDGHETLHVFFSERANGKRQVFYFAGRAVVRSWRVGEAFVRNIKYTIGGSPGAPRDLHVSLSDKDDRRVTWDVEFAPGQPLTPYGAALRDSVGHSRELVYSLPVRGQSATAVKSTLHIGDADYSFSPDPSDRPPYRFRYGYGAGYTAGEYTTIVRIGALSCHTATESLLCPEWHDLRRMETTTGATRPWKPCDPVSSTAIGFHGTISRV